ncbi:Uncharacterized protein dnl_49900 [Desulfonema limicola]|uniref:Uncharacterized protein n=1 Tax=Desulfonema limicola TaxID=45656 RepID=A0A975BBZ0_9BACT|nr:Uncharacterized protein dnl_49900 [Desulfonema limicola]
MKVSTYLSIILNVKILLYMINENYYNPVKNKPLDIKYKKG